MFNLNFGKKTFLGVDVGTSAIKMAELELKNGKISLLNYAWMPLVGKAGDRRELNDEFFGNDAPEYLRKLISESGCSGHETYMSLPAYQGIITLINFPRLAESDMEQAIRFEAHKYIPTSLDEVVLSWEIIGDAAPQDPKGAVQGAKVDVFLVAASKKQIGLYEKLARDSKLRLAGIEMENIAMVRSLVGNDPGNFLLVDIGYCFCDILYVERGVIKLNMNFDAGGEEVTRTLMRSMNITWERAEKYKMSGKKLLERESGMHFSTLENIIQEVSRLIDTVSKGPGGRKIDSIILSGGGSLLGGLPEYFQSRLGINTTAGDPFSRIDRKKELDPFLDQMKGGFSVAVGLAMIGVEKQLKKELEK